MNTNELKQILIDQAGQRAQGQNAALAKEFIEAYVALCDEERRAKWGIESGAALRDSPPGLDSGAAIEMRPEATSELIELRRAVVDRIVREIERRNIHVRDTSALDGWRYNVYEGKQLIRGCSSVEEVEFRVAQLLQMCGTEASAIGHALRDALNIASLDVVAAARDERPVSFKRHQPELVLYPAPAHRVPPFYPNVMMLEEYIGLEAVEYARNNVTLERVRVEGDAFYECARRLGVKLEHSKDGHPPHFVAHTPAGPVIVSQLVPSASTEKTPGDDPR